MSGFLFSLLIFFSFDHIDFEQIKNDVKEIQTHRKTPFDFCELIILCFEVLKQIQLNQELIKCILFLANIFYHRATIIYMKGLRANSAYFPTNYKLSSDREKYKPQHPLHKVSNCSSYLIKEEKGSVHFPRKKSNEMFRVARTKETEKTSTMKESRNVTTQLQEYGRYCKKGEYHHDNQNKLNKSRSRSKTIARSLRQLQPHKKVVYAAKITSRRIPTEPSLDSRFIRTFKRAKSVLEEYQKYLNISERERIKLLDENRNLRQIIQEYMQK